MSTNTVLKRYAMGSTLDINTQSETPQYKLGEVVTIFSDTENAVRKYMYVRAHEALTAYSAYTITFSSTAGREVTTAKPATSSILILPCIAPISTTSGYYCWVQIQGLCKALAESGSETIGHTAKLVNNKYTVTTNSNSTITGLTIGMFVATGSTSGASFYLEGNNNRVTI